MDKIIHTDRLILRQFTKDDIEAIFDIQKDKEVNTYLPWYPLKTLEEAEKFFYEKYENEYKNNNPYKYAICLKEDNIPIGYLGLTSNESYDLGYGLKKEFWHIGIVTEAVKGFIEMIKKENIPYITATHDIKNTRSGGVMKNVGMKYCYTYKEMWQPKNILVTFRMYQLNFDNNKNRVYKEYWDKYPEHFIEKDV